MSDPNWGIFCKTEEHPEGEWLVDIDDQALLFTQNDAQRVASLLSAGEMGCKPKIYDGELPSIVYQGKLLEGIL